ncbi:hypothetical protein HTZ77_29070 [Nonomuraea sp. SMC257]|uniref:DUF3995 domain-containing protein n=1 Tax=Nonomuraea montanisoli TaxID=2741721 RepID=A0A7Y6IC08_9ACTN|nr:hypothetical protein [Nonomuraea montanisoli]NUW35452.1 hypothetical protein [Nonomuraea montanisoli]
MTATTRAPALLAAVWSAGYVALGAAWALGVPGFPWGAGDPDPDGALSLLAGLDPGPGGWWVAAFAALALVVSLALAGTPRPGGRTGRVAVGAAWALAAALVLAIPDSRLMMGVAYTPLLMFSGFFDGPFGQVGLADAWPWPVLNQVLCLLGGLLLARAAVAWRRRARAACAACGRDEEESGWTSRESAARWGRRAVAVAVATPLVYCMTRWAWALGIPLGVSPEFLAEGTRDTPGIWLAGAYLATFGALGGLLTLGLVQRWGEVFPRWIPGLRGRRVPPPLAVVPASFVAIIIVVAGLTYVRATVAGRFSMAEWGAWLPECFWPVWGAALGAAALAYHLRRRPACRRCGRGSADLVTANVTQG